MERDDQDVQSQVFKMLGKSLIMRLEQDLLPKEDPNFYPVDAATLGVIRQWLKDNSTTASPATNTELKDLQERLREQSKRRRESISNVISMADRDTGTD